MLYSPHQSMLLQRLAELILLSHCTHSSLTHYQTTWFLVAIQNLKQRVSCSCKYLGYCCWLANEIIGINYYFLILYDTSMQFITNSKCLSCFRRLTELFANMGMFSISFFFKNPNLYNKNYEMCSQM